MMTKGRMHALKEVIRLMIIKFMADERSGDSRLVLWTWTRMMEKTREIWKA